MFMSVDSGCGSFPMYISVDVDVFAYADVYFHCCVYPVFDKQEYCSYFITRMIGKEKYVRTEVFSCYIDN